tara:strand:- start:211 stop:378 length:168 start_codon:yes stop_codon:yes gene_type:complete
VSKIIKKTFPKAKIRGNDKPPRSGSFEVTINKKLIYSKLSTGTFPKEIDILDWFK